MAPTHLNARFASQNLSRRQAAHPSYAVRPHNARHMNNILSAGTIAGITVGSLVALAFLLCGIGAITNCIRVSKRNKERAEIEAQHRRWPQLEPAYPPVAAIPTTDNYPHPKLVNHVLSHSMDSGRSDSPESQSSQARLLTRKFSKSLPAIPLQIPSQIPSRPESNLTLFEDARLSDVFIDSHSQQGRLGPPTGQPQPLASSLRPKKPPPARIRIPLNSSAPPPIIISPPRKATRSPGSPSDASPASKANPRPTTSTCQVAPEATRDILLRPAPPFAAANRGVDMSLLSPASIAGSPGYLPSYYTNPTPPAPVPTSRLHCSTVGDGFSPPQDNTFVSPISALASAPDLDPSSASSGFTDTSLGSMFAEDIEAEEEQTSTEPRREGLDSPIRHLRYPRVPKPTDQETPESGGWPIALGSPRMPSSSVYATPNPSFGATRQDEQSDANRQPAQNGSPSGRPRKLSVPQSRLRPIVTNLADNRSPPRRFEKVDYPPDNSVAAWVRGHGGNTSAPQPFQDHQRRPQVHWN